MAIQIPEPEYCIKANQVDSTCPTIPSKDWINSLNDNLSLPSHYAQPTKELVKRITRIIQAFQATQSS